MLDSLILLAIGAIPGVLIFGIFLFVSFITPYESRTKEEFLQEKTAFDPSGVENHRFKKLLKLKNKNELEHTDPEVYVSVVIPAMNEEERLPVMLEECLEYLNSRAKESKEFTFEIIVVDDGSKDKTSEVAFNQGRKQEENKLYVLKLPKNVGKGGAVRFGTFCARGKIILFADADGATKFEEFEKLETALVDACSDGDYFEWEYPAVSIGSRAHLAEKSKAERTFFRTILMKGFHLVVWLFAVKSIKDTQCGFKMFTRSAAAMLFPKLHIERWAFDVELLYLAEKAGIPIKELSVDWKEIAGSKITPIISWIQMGRDILLIWFRYTFRIWNADGLVKS
ncbi:hypothetical protein FO519_004588 [Halicephalobus sp. NKZ332]|nr:hypothetical protein FO519_004588 [Halicephalobus sp. NKZ332]